MGPMFMGTGQDRDRASRDQDGSGTAACGNRRERDWKTSPVQHSTSDNYDEPLLQQYWTNTRR